MLQAEDKLTFNNETYGLTIQNNTLKGVLNIYNFYDDITKEKYLDLILSTKILEFENRRIGDILSENMIQLYIEPGRSMLDQVGITVAKVNFCKQSQKNDILIGLDMKRSDVTMQDQDLFIDPYIISNEQNLEDSVGVYFLGSLCLESDLIYRHKVFVNKIPKKDDLVIFFNTAGYFMDFSSCDSIMQKVAKKIVIAKSDDTYNTYMDQEYSPYKFLKN